MYVNVIYVSEPLIDKNNDRGGQLFERSFTSIDMAQKTPLPEGFVFASISVEDGYYVHTPRLGWEFCPNFKDFANA